MSRRNKPTWVGDWFYGWVRPANFRVNNPQRESLLLREALHRMARDFAAAAPPKRAAADEQGFVDYYLALVRLDAEQAREEELDNGTT